ncbi:DNA mismatch repair protein [Sphingomonas sinipercae]|uniref:DNA mismatch repair protein n=1 Tax=Sphingomonas sinipercae TaxID=2714944 RepID=A0A6G7ZLN2_9SPHN|nr:ATP-binding protein [Sphingomonas sinipercae]QIL01832.1 DNA mismatch repair protein [Sphingomonas sinipercae]
MADESGFTFAISLSVLNHLGRNLYRNFITVLSEAISNAWDADARNVWIDFDKDAAFLTIKDDGLGMSPEDFQKKFLKIGYSKRKDGGNKTERGRPFIGAKGIGKLALLSCAERVTVLTKQEGGSYTGGVIDNSGLDEAITDNLNPDEYPLETPDTDLVEALLANHERGTILAFENAREVLRTSEEQIRKLLALSFHFSLIDPEFKIHVNGKPISVDDLKGLAEATQFVWKIGEYTDDFLDLCGNVLRWTVAPETKLSVVGYLATVRKPSDLNIRGADNRATVDLFVNGRLRERNVLRHIPTQRIVESYLYGQIHFDAMEGNGDSPFTSSREGIVETDPNFSALIDYLRREAVPRVIDQWDEFRIARGQEGDDENPRKTKKQRRASGLVSAAEEEFTQGLPKEQGDVVDGWIAGLRPDAEYNVEAYVDCFLSENLVRQYLTETGSPLTDDVKPVVTKFRDRETASKEKANINFDVRRDGGDLTYLGMHELSICAEGAPSKDGKINPMVQAAIAFKPTRDAVGHTGVLTEAAKKHLNVTFENIKGRVRNLLGSMTTKETSSR